MKPSVLRKFLYILPVLCLAACSVRPPFATPSPVEVIPSPSATNTLVPTPTSTPEPTPTLTPYPVPLNGACSPLGGIGLAELHSITSNTFDAPSAFSDLGHPAVDLAFFTHKGFSTMLGLPVQSMLPGKVVQVVDNRFPFGNMILIETPLSLLSVDLVQSLPLPTPIPEKSIEMWSTCDKNIAPITWSDDSKSIYILYSHLQSKPDFQVGDTVACGQQIGAVGITGNSVAEHLHLEMRIGPSDARFGTIAMYTNQVYTQVPTSEERYNYCIWTISGRFQAFDPASFWKDKP